jgi:hypothetical protein
VVSFSVLSEGLGKNFVTVSVNVVDCPDLTQKPFNLSAPGMHSNKYNNIVMLSE